MQQVASLSRRANRRALARWFWSLSVALVTGFVVSLAAWDYVNGLLARSPVLGGDRNFALLVALFCLVLCGDCAA